MRVTCQHQSKKSPIRLMNCAVPILWALLLILNPFAQSLWASTNSPKPALIHVKALVNGDERVVPAGEQLDLVLGDKLVLTAATVSVPDGRKVRSSLNFVGFPGSNPDRPWDDIGVEINTSRDIVFAYAINKSEDKKENIFLVRCEAAGVTVGSITVRVFQPRLKFAEVQINGQSRAMRDGELLTVAGEDQIKILRFESNVSNPADVAFRFQASSAKVLTPDGPIRPGYEFVFSRSGILFARIPVRIEK